MNLEEKQELIRRVLIGGSYPHSQVVLGNLENEFGIVLTEICRKPFNGGLKYKYSDRNKWLGPRKPLSWGNNTGWNVTEDCKHALCRVGYDDYINYELKFMKTETNKKLSEEIEKFWIRSVMGTGEEWMRLSIKRAYRDLNRTIHGIGKIQEKLKLEKFERVILTVNNVVNGLVNNDFSDINQYDQEHEKGCDLLIKEFNSAFINMEVHELTIGQAQKWINMTLKYLITLGENRVNGILKNIEYFHIPVDDIIQAKFLKDHGIERLKDGVLVKWSRVNSYLEYIKYQKAVREKFQGRIPIIVEFEEFNY